MKPGALLSILALSVIFFALFISCGEEDDLDAMNRELADRMT